MYDPGFQRYQTCDIFFIFFKVDQNLKKAANLEFGAVRKCEHLVELEKPEKKYLDAKIGVHTAENMADCFSIL